MIAPQTKVTIIGYPGEGTVLRCEGDYVCVEMEDGMEIRVKAKECLPKINPEEVAKLMGSHIEKKDIKSKAQKEKTAKHLVSELVIDLHLDALKHLHLVTDNDIPLQAQLNRFQQIMRENKNHKGGKNHFHPRNQRSHPKRFYNKGT